MCEQRVSAFLNSITNSIQSLGIEEWAAVFVALFTGVYTVGTLLMWWTSHKNAKLIQRQLEMQNKHFESISYHGNIDAHRDIFSFILADNDVREIVFSESEAEIDEKDRKKSDIIGSILINHCLRMYVDYKNEIQSSENFERFKLDASSMFSIPVVQLRWKNIKQYHRDDFRDFIDKNVLPILSAGDTHT